MRHKVHTFKIGRTGAHRKAMLANMVSSLIEHGQIKTTITKAKEARRVADKMVTLGKKGTLASRRQAAKTVRFLDAGNDKNALQKLFSDIAPRFTDRPGGYTRVYKMGPRRGDATPMAIIEFVE